MPTFDQQLVNKTSSTTTGGKTMQHQGPTLTDCERAGCLDHCAKTQTDPWIYAFVGTLVGVGLGGGIAYAFGRKARRR